MYDNISNFLFETRFSNIRLYFIIHSQLNNTISTKYLFKLLFVVHLIRIRSRILLYISNLVSTIQK